MKNQAVKLKIVPYMEIECKFWVKDDGWNGITEASSSRASHIKDSPYREENLLGMRRLELLTSIF